MISPTTEGTKATEPGMSLLSVQWRFVPGGQMQWARQLMLRSSSGLSGFSFE
jgi:hypothetical protein